MTRPTLLVVALLVLAGCQAENRAAPPDPFLFGPTRVPPPGTGTITPQPGLSTSRPATAGVVSPPASGLQSSAVAAMPAPAFGGLVQSPAASGTATPVGDQVQDSRCGPQAGPARPARCRQQLPVPAPCNVSRHHVNHPQWGDLRQPRFFLPGVAAWANRCRSVSPGGHAGHVLSRGRPAERSLALRPGSGRANAVAEESGYGHPLAVCPARQRPAAASPGRFGRE